MKFHIDYEVYIFIEINLNQLGGRNLYLYVSPGGSWHIWENRRVHEFNSDTTFFSYSTRGPWMHISIRKMPMKTTIFLLLDRQTKKKGQQSNYFLSIDGRTKNNNLIRGRWAYGGPIGLVAPSKKSGLSGMEIYRINYHLSTYHLASSVGLLTLYTHSRLWVWIEWRHLFLIFSGLALCVRGFSLGLVRGHALQPINEILDEAFFSSL